MKERQNVAVAVLSGQQDDVELINSVLRNAGQAAHCTWVTDSGAFNSCLEETELDLVVVNSRNLGIQCTLCIDGLDLCVGHLLRKLSNSPA